MRVLVLIFLVFLCCNINAQPQIKVDSSAVVVRSLSNDALQSYRHDKEFQYQATVETERSAWERFWDWVWYKIDQVLSTRKGKITVWSLIILLAVGVIAYFFVTITGMNRQGLFVRSSKSGLNYDVTAEDIHNIPFDEAISQAISSSNFRLAIRLLYLKSLKRLSDEGYILWEVNKTNSDYLTEVNDKSWHEIFATLTRQFEYTWYGEMNIGRDDFEGLQLQFQQFNNRL